MIATLLSFMLCGQVRDFYFPETFSGGNSNTAGYGDKADSDWQPYKGPNPLTKDKKPDFDGEETMEIYVSTQVVPDGDQSKTIYTDTCWNACQGPPPNHASHADCDRTCDKPCQAKHQFKLPLIQDFVPADDPYGETLHSVNQAIDVIQNRGHKFTSSLSHLEEVVGKALKDFKDMPKDKAGKEMNLGHMFMSPYEACTGGTRAFTADKMKIQVRTTILSVYRTSKGIAGSVPLQTLGPFTIGTVWVTRKDPKVKKGTNCKCEKTYTPVGEHTMGRINYKTMPQELCNATVDTYKNIFTTGDGPTFTGMNLNHMTASCNGGTYELAAGTTFLCDNSEYQDMVLFDDASCTSGPHWLASLDPEPETHDLRVMCINMHKKMPDSTVHYLPIPPKDDTIAMFAQRTAKSNYRGPWDQTRFWIYTDHASLAEIQKILHPSVNAARYRDLLAEVAQSGLSKGSIWDYDDLVTEDVLLTPGGNAGAVYWAVHAAVRNHMSLSGAIGNSAAEKIFAPGADQPVKFAATLGRAICLLDNSDAPAALENLTQAVPEDKRAEFVKAGGLSLLPMWADSEDKKRKAVAEKLASYGK